MRSGYSIVSSNVECGASPYFSLASRDNVKIPAKYMESADEWHSPVLIQSVLRFSLRLFAFERVPSFHGK